MTEVDTVNPLHKLYSVLNSIVNNMIDINQDRANAETAKERQWWFPNYPEKNDENYPRGSIAFTNLRIQEYGSAQYIGEVLENNVVIKEQYGQYMLINVTLSVFVKKDQRQEINNIIMQNQKLADYMIFELQNTIRKYRTSIMTPSGFDIEGNINITPAYDDNHFLFAADINFDIITLNAWNVDYATDQLIAEILQTINVERVC